MADMQDKVCGRFIAKPPNCNGGRSEIWQTHANGSDEVISMFIHLDQNTLRDLQYLVNRLLEVQVD